MKRFIFAVSMFCFSSVSFAGGDLTSDSKGRAVQGFSPDGRFSQILTINSTTFDLSNKLSYSVYTESAGCKVRIMPTSDKGSNKQTTVPANNEYFRVVNNATPFVNLSGCTSAELQLQ